MSTRDIAAANITASEADHVVPVKFVHMALDSGDLRLHNAIGSLEFDSNTYTGVGDFGSIEALEESADLTPFAVRFQLSGLDSTILNAALTEDYFGRDVKIYLGWLSDGALVADPDEWWSGSVDKMDVVRGPDNAVVVTAESELRLFRKSNGKLFTDEDQQLDFAGDLFFEYVPQLQEARAVWGGQGANPLKSNTPRLNRPFLPTPFP